MRGYALVALLTLVLVFLALMASTASAQLRLPLLISDGAVLQRDQPIPIWGWAEPEASVEVTLGAVRQAATADASGRWRVTFPALRAGETTTLRVASGNRQLEVQDLLAGDVWVLSGQSNMEWVVRESRNADEEIQSAGDPQIRHFKVPRSHAETPQLELAGGTWERESPRTVGDFSAVGTFFARAVRQHHDVPIGLVNATWGGSRIEPWMSAQMLGLNAADVVALQASQRNAVDAMRDRLRALIGGLPDTDAGMNGPVAVWASPDLDDSDWATIPVPAYWEGEGYEGLDGVAWYRTSFTLSEAEAHAGVTLGLGQIDDTDVTWVNGVEVGQMANAWNEARRYEVPASVLRAGDNHLAVRVIDNGGRGGIAGDTALVYLDAQSGRRPLPEDWRFKVGIATVNEGGSKNQEPMGLWNQMIHPLLPMPVAGVLWYQGESNANSVEEAEAYADHFQTLISGWREAWRQPEMPFFWVQLAAFRAPPHTPDDTGVWPTLRASQSTALELPNTAEAITLDVGDADDIHPRDKQTVGHRLALAARRLVYGEPDLVHSGPRYQGHQLDGSRVRVSFDHADDGLATLGGAPLGGFALAGADGVWHWAQARIEEEHVVVWADAVPAPVAVRYAWADNPEGATLANAEGLPAAPFEVDL